MTNEIFLENIQYLREKYHLKKGEFEKQINVSSGYFSRLAKDPTREPDESVVKKIALKYPYTVETLKEKRISEDDNPYNIRLINFLNKLQMDTSNGVCWWEKDDYNIESEYIHPWDKFEKYFFLNEYSERECIFFVDYKTGDVVYLVKVVTEGNRCITYMLFVENVKEYDTTSIHKICDSFTVLGCEKLLENIYNEAQRKVMKESVDSFSFVFMEKYLKDN